MSGNCLSSAPRLPIDVLALVLVVPVLLSSILLATPAALPSPASTPTPFPSAPALDPWVVHTAGHFRIQPPSSWIVRVNLTTSGGVIDVLLRGQPDQGQGPVGGVIGVTHEARANLGSAQSILQEGIDGLSAFSAFRIVEPVHDTTVNGHAAAEVVVMYEPSTYDVYEILIVVVGPEWYSFWALEGIVFSWDVPSISPSVNESLATFEVLPAPPRGALAAASDWFLLGGLIATAAAGTVFGFLILRSTRPRRP